MLTTRTTIAIVNKYINNNFINYDITYNSV